MKKTKIICTLGPNTNEKEMMLKLAKNGMNVARFNFSHGDHEEQLSRLEILRDVRKELGLPIAALLDTKGPEIRTGVLRDEPNKAVLVEGDTFILTTKDVLCDNKMAHISYDRLPEDVTAGNKILIDDGLIELLVKDVKGADIICEVVNGGELGSKKGVNVPNVSIKLPALTEKDKDDILFGIDQDFDFIAASFVRNADCIREIKSILKLHGSHIQVIAKIENAEGIENIDEIIEVSDGIMVARGDMGVEIPVEEVPHIQKMIINKCDAARKPVITATQMLDSMIRNPRPTRAEVTDVANAIYDGTDAVMLSGETAMGKYPVEALKMMVQIAESTERYLDYNSYRHNKLQPQKKKISNALSLSSVATASTLNAKAIIAPTMSGFTATMLSKWRPYAPIYGMSPNRDVLRKMQLLWGVYPVYAAREASTDAIIDNAVEELKKKQYLQEGDLVVVTVGIPPKKQEAISLGETNNMRVLSVE